MKKNLSAIFAALALMVLVIAPVSKASADVSTIAVPIICQTFNELNQQGSPIPNLTPPPGCETGTTPPPSPQVENTLALCTDAIDNDHDTKVDLDDSDCASFRPVLTLTVSVAGGPLGAGDFMLFLDGGLVSAGYSAAITPGTHAVTVTGHADYTSTIGGDCDASGHVTLAPGQAKSCTITHTYGSTSGGGSASEDMCNNIDGVQTSIPEGKVRENGNCVNPQGTSNDSHVDPNPDAGGGSSSGGGGGGYIQYESVDAPKGEVLGTSTELSCSPLLTTYMRMGQRNNGEEVKKLQSFLNTHMNLNMPVTGFFGPMTDSAVRKFQVTYSSDVLAPWLPHGLKNDKAATGYVYKTTQRKINLLYCSTLDLPIPPLP